MNSLFIVTITIVVFWFGYVFYARRLERIFKPNPNKKTPAHFKYDGVDFVPAKHWAILFVHHFVSIAGAAPIIGPIINSFYMGLGADFNLGFIRHGFYRRCA